MKVGENIKKLRELKNLTQQHLADELGISLSGYGKTERDETDITLERLQKISDILAVDPFTLIHFNRNNVLKAVRNTDSPSKDFKSNLDDTHDWQNKLLLKYEEENKYLKELIKQLLEKN